jgi:ribosomal protein S18 acetylase RimI-like enzyme
MTLINDDRAAAAAAHRVHVARRDEAPRLVAALAGAFQDDPVFRWFSPDDARRAAMLPAFFAVFVEAFTAHGDSYGDDHGAGAALWSPPGIDPMDADPGYAERLAAVAGVDAGRLFEIVELLHAHAPQEPHHHLQFLGVRPDRQGLGLGGALMAPGLERCDREVAAAYLEATSDRNRALYERHGFRAHGSIPIPGGPALWRMWRDPAG